LSTIKVGFMNVQQGPCFSRPGLYGGFGGFDRGRQELGGQVYDYGAAAPMKAAAPFFARGQRQRLNVVPIFQCFFLPWLLFCGIYALVSFEMHYTSPGLCWALAGLALFFVLLCGGYLVVAAWFRSREAAYRGGEPSAKSPSWLTFLVVSSLVAWLLAVVLGNLNFWTNMQQHYDYTNLNEYTEVNPARMRGKQLMDGGRVVFTNNSAIDLRRSMGFKNLDTYCVAPITIRSPSAGTELPLQTYDFWAVGLDCCTSNAADFHCGDFASRSAHQGLRLLRDDQRPFFRLAVQQAEAAHGIKATHPLFFYWTNDATAEMNFFRDEGYKYFLVGMLAHFGWQALIVALAVAGFAKIGQL